MNTVVLSVIFLGCVSLFLGICIVLTSKLFKTYENPLIQTVTKLLPGANCGGCGRAGCSAFAKELVETRSTSMSCPVGGQSLREQLGSILGIKLQAATSSVARVLCQGNFNKSKISGEYEGIKDCVAVKQAMHGSKLCPYSCIGYGTCKNTCKYGAISIVNGVAIVDDTKCVGCGECIRNCPMGCLALLPKDQKVFVACRSQDKGGVTRKLCETGCIGCGKCTRVCENGAITVTNFVSKIDYSKCTGCGKCYEVCPSHCIVNTKVDKNGEKENKG